MTEGSKEKEHKNRKAPGPHQFRLTQLVMWSLVAHFAAWSLVAHYFKEFVRVRGDCIWVAEKILLAILLTVRLPFEGV